MWDGDGVAAKECLPGLTDFARVFAVFGAEIAVRTGEGLPEGRDFRDYLLELPTEQQVRFTSPPAFDGAHSPFSLIRPR